MAISTKGGFMTGDKWMFMAAALYMVPCLANAQAVVTERSISVDAALDMAKASLDACRKHGSAVTITVLDRAARPVVTIRENGASPHSVEHSLRKAYTALTYNMPSADYGKRVAAEPGAAAGPLHLANMTTAAGGLPIRAGNTLVGAIGISGTPGAKGGGEADAGCAQAGIDRVAKALVAN
jgi:uncharacterized protein GlcG (DUF336 family)